MIVEPHGWRRSGGQPQPGRAALLRGFDHDLPADLAGSEVGAALGAQAGEAKLREVITSGG